MAISKVALLTISLLFCLTLPIMGQETTGTILGTVTDSSGAVLPGAAVTITNTDKNAVIRKLNSSKDGSFVAPLLPIGHYSVTVEAKGFKAVTRSNIELNIRDQYRVDSALSPGSVAEATITLGTLPARLSSIKTISLHRTITIFPGTNMIPTPSITALGTPFIRRW